VEFLRKTAQIATLRDDNSGPRAVKRGQLPGADGYLPPSFHQKLKSAQMHQLFGKIAYFLANNTLFNINFASKTCIFDYFILSLHTKITLRKKKKGWLCAFLIM
jgi:hypothetical protein